LVTFFPNAFSLTEMWLGSKDPSPKSRFSLCRIPRKPCKVCPSASSWTIDDLFSDVNTHKVMVPRANVPKRGFVGWGGYGGRDTGPSLETGSACRHPLASVCLKVKFRAVALRGMYPTVAYCLADGPGLHLELEMCPKLTDLSSPDLRVEASVSEGGQHELLFQQGSYHPLR
jgi:hypothetical protein